MSGRVFCWDPAFLGNIGGLLHFLQAFTGAWARFAAAICSFSKCLSNALRVINYEHAEGLLMESQLFFLVLKMGNVCCWDPADFWVTCCEDFGAVVKSCELLHPSESPWDWKAAGRQWNDP